MCSAIGNLVQDRGHALSFQRAGGAHALTSVIGGEDRSAAASAAAALANLATAVDAHNVQVDETCIRRLVGMLAETRAVDAMLAISSLCDSAPTRERFLANGVEGALVQASKSHQDPQARQRAGKVLVKVLQSGEGGHQRIVQLGGWPLCPPTADDIMSFLAPKISEISLYASYYTPGYGAGVYVPLVTPKP